MANDNSPLKIELSDLTTRSELAQVLAEASLNEFSTVLVIDTDDLPTVVLGDETCFHTALHSW